MCFAWFPLRYATDTTVQEIQKPAKLKSRDARYMSCLRLGCLSRLRNGSLSLALSSLACEYTLFCIQSNGNKQHNGLFTSGSKPCYKKSNRLAKRALSYVALAMVNSTRKYIIGIKNDIMRIFISLIIITLFLQCKNAQRYSIEVKNSLKDTIMFKRFDFELYKRNAWI